MNPLIATFGSVPGMLSRVSCLAVFCAISALAAPPVIVPGALEPWPKIFGSIGVSVEQTTDLPPAKLVGLVESGAFAVLEGTSPYAEAFAIRPTDRRVPVQSIVDSNAPKLPIIWQKQLELGVYNLPPDATIFATERWTGAPVVAGIRRGKGAVLWLIAPPGEKGYERFPYVLQALSQLGLTPPARSNRLWAFFDGAYRRGVDLDYFAERWHRAGISALQVAAWHYDEPDPERDEFVRKLITACHRKAIQVYAWVELPHVGEQFWHKQPQCREKTAILQDAQLDWRKLINLTNRDCFNQVSRRVTDMLNRFDWDGVNLAELYFESLEGTANAARFTPMNDDVRKAFEAEAGIDPLKLFEPGADPALMKRFLEYRGTLVQKMQEEWIAEIQKLRRTKPHLDLVLTHVDDRFDTRMRELIGADASRVLPLLDKHDFTFLIEDPATVWHLGPERYSEIAKRYQPLTNRADKLAIDINIVERYQDVYPTKQQTGTELFQLVHLSAKAFPRVALYFENSILKADLDLLPASAAAVERAQLSGGKLIVESPRGAGFAWNGPAKVNGRLWPFVDRGIVWVPAGAHVIESAPSDPPLMVTSFNGDLKSASVANGRVDFSYESSARAFAILSQTPAWIEVDGDRQPLTTMKDNVLMLPRGQHLVTLGTQASVEQLQNTSQSSLHTGTRGVKAELTPKAEQLLKRN